MVKAIIALLLLISVSMVIQTAKPVGSAIPA